MENKVVEIGECLAHTFSLIFTVRIASLGMSCSSKQCILFSQVLNDSGC